MRNTFLFLFALLTGVVVSAADKADSTVRRDAAGQPQSDLHATATNAVHRARPSSPITYSGVVVHAVKSKQPWQMINPFAPASFGSGESYVSRDPVAGHGATGFKLFSLGF